MKYPPNFAGVIPSTFGSPVNDKYTYSVIKRVSDTQSSK